VNGLDHLGDLISALVDGELPPRAARRAKRHLIECPLCQLELEIVQDTRLAIRQAGRPLGERRNDPTPARAAGLGRQTSAKAVARPALIAASLLLASVLAMTASGSTPVTASRGPNLPPAVTAGQVTTTSSEIP
jgi:anti-sigma factor RsiW